MNRSEIRSNFKKELLGLKWCGNTTRTLTLPISPPTCGQKAPTWKMASSAHFESGLATVAHIFLRFYLLWSELGFHGTDNIHSFSCRDVNVFESKTSAFISNVSFCTFSNVLSVWAVQFPTT